MKCKVSSSFFLFINVTVVTEDNELLKTRLCVCVLVHSLNVGHGNGSGVFFPSVHWAGLTYIVQYDHLSHTHAHIQLAIQVKTYQRLLLILNKANHNYNPEPKILNLQILNTQKLQFKNISLESYILILIWANLKQHAVFKYLYYFPTQIK